MKPSADARIFTPSSTPAVSLTAGVEGAAAGVQIVAFATGAEVVNDQETGDMTLPARSAAPLSVAVYVELKPRAAFGLSVTVRVPALYERAPAMTVFAASRSTRE